MQEELTSAVESRPTIRSSKTIMTETPARELHPTNGFPRPVLNRTSTFEGPTQLRHEQAPVASQWIQRTTSDTLSAQRSLPTNGRTFVNDPYADSEEVSSYGRSSPERSYGARSSSPATSHGSVASRRPSATALNSVPLNKKAPPPPPPSRSKKPPPPPPPMKRTLVAATDA